MSYFIFSVLILYAYYFVYVGNEVDKGTGGNVKEAFTQMKKTLSDLKKTYLMYIGLKKPNNPEERCLPVQGDVGSVIDKAISFCG